MLSVASVFELYCFKMWGSELVVVVVLSMCLRNVCMWNRRGAHMNKSRRTHDMISSQKLLYIFTHVCVYWTRYACCSAKQNPLPERCTNYTVHTLGCTCGFYTYIATIHIRNCWNVRWILVHTFVRISMLRLSSSRHKHSTLSAPDRQRQKSTVTYTWENTYYNHICLRKCSHFDLIRGQYRTRCYSI